MNCSAKYRAFTIKWTTYCRMAFSKNSKEYYNHTALIDILCCRSTCFFYQLRRKPCTLTSHLRKAHEHDVQRHRCSDSIQSTRAFGFIFGGAIIALGFGIGKDAEQVRCVLPRHFAQTLTLSLQYRETRDAPLQFERVYKIWESITVVNLDREHGNHTKPLA